eukprot:353770-Chlamydomonas_euryale.AAC.2
MGCARAIQCACAGAGSVSMACLLFECQTGVCQMHKGLPDAHAPHAEPGLGFLAHHEHSRV